MPDGATLKWPTEPNLNCRKEEIDIDGSNCFSHGFTTCSGYPAT